MTLVKYEYIEIRETGEPLVDLSTCGFNIEPMYYRTGLSDEPNIFIRKAVAEKLLRISKELAPLKFVIWDGWRPRKVQHNIYMKYWSELRLKNPDWNEEQLKITVSTFVTPATDQSKIPIHSTGGAIDLTIAEPSGRLLNMGTDFDYFGPEAGPFYYEENKIDPNISNNRRILREAMLSEEFRFDGDEWWHFDYGTQIWAAAFNKPFALYGEITLP